MSKRQLEFWFEYGSTYTYLSVMRIADMAGAAGVEVKWRPFLLIPLLMERGLDQGPFLPYPDKLRYMWRDLERRAAVHRLPYRQPATYPPNTLLTARIGLHLDALGRSKSFTEGVFRRHWQEGIYIGTDENIRATLAELGLESDEVIARATSEENKTALREQTATAKSLGIFGAPSFVVKGELFWGDDRLEDAINWAIAGM